MEPVLDGRRPDAHRHRDFTVSVRLNTARHYISRHSFHDKPEHHDSRHSMGSDILSIWRLCRADWRVQILGGRENLAGHLTRFRQEKPKIEFMVCYFS